MPGPYSPPNPYGAYFSFGQPEGVAQQAFGPMPYGGLSPGTMGMMGQASSGFNPTGIEYLTAKTRQFYQDQFLATLARNDPRAITLTTALLAQMGNQARQNDVVKTFGGRGIIQELVGTALSMPGIAGMLGGSPLALGQGAYAIASSGMGVNGAIMSGDGPLQLLAARAMTQRMTSQFFLSSGAANTQMTQGLNRDQLGGLMMLGASQGAFAGLNMATMTKMGDQTTWKLDEGTMAKITQFTKSAAKAIGSLIDIYGDRSVAELAQKAQAITGMDLSRLGNAQIMVNRLGAVRRAAEAAGMDPMMAMDLVAAGTTMGVNLGISRPMAGLVSNRAFNNATLSAAGFRQAGNVFDMATPDIRDIQSAQVRDAAAMFRDPVGLTRTAMMAMINSGQFAAGDIPEARRLMRRSGYDAIRDMELFAQQKGGWKMRGFIDLMGGPVGLQQSMNEDQKTELLEMQEEDKTARASRVFRMRFKRTLSSTMGTGAGVDALFTLAGIMKPETLKNIFAGPGTNPDIRRLVTEDIGGALDVNTNVGLISTVFSEFGSKSGAMNATMQKMIGAGNFLENFPRLADRAGRALASASPISWSDEQRTQLGQHSFDALLNKLKGTDPRTSWVRQMKYMPRTIFGWRTDKWQLPMNMEEAGAVDTMQTTLAAMAEELKGIPEGQEFLRNLGIRPGMQRDEINAQMATSAFTQIHNALMNDTPGKGLFRHFITSGGVGGGGGRTFGMGLASVNKQIQETGPSLDVAYALAEGFSRTGDTFQENKMLKLAALMTAQPDKVGQITRLLGTEARNIDMLSGLSDATLRAVAQMSPSIAKEMMSELEYKSGEAGGRTAAERATSMRQVGVLRAAGIVPEEDFSKITRLEGNLIIQGNVLKLDKGRLVITPNAAK